jgi:hypothetical protein
MNRNDFVMRRQPPGYGDERQQLGDAAYAHDLHRGDRDELRDAAAKAREEEEELRNTEAEGDRAEHPDY